MRSVVGVITATPRGNRPKLYLRILKSTVRSGEVIGSVRELRRHVRGKLILLWDGLAPHRSQKTRAFLKTQRRWLAIERYPAYAPELNPVEYVWSSGKKRDLANFCPDTLEMLDRRIRKHARRLQRRPDTLKGFLRASTLFP